MWTCSVSTRAISQQSQKFARFDLHEKRHLAVDVGTISLKGIVQRKGPVALPSSGRKRTIWFGRVYASPEPLFTAGKFSVVVKLLDLHSSGGFDRGSNPVGPKIFFLVKKSRVTSLPSLFPTKSCQIVASLSPALHSKWNQGKELSLWTRTKQFGFRIRCTPQI